MLLVGLETCQHILHLYHYDNHFCVITSMPGFFSRSFYCETCEIPYANKEDHRCYNKCSSCYHSPPCYRSNIITCEDCGRLFKSQKCMDNHKRKYKKDENQLKKEKHQASRNSALEKRKNESEPESSKRLRINNDSFVENQILHEAEKSSKMSHEYNLSVCECFRRCTKCFKQFLTTKFDSHKCGVRRCNLCKQDVDAKSNILLNIYL